MKPTKSKRDLLPKGMILHQVVKKEVNIRCLFRLNFADDSESPTKNHLPFKGRDSRINAYTSIGHTYTCTPPRTQVLIHYSRIPYRLSHLRRENVSKIGDPPKHSLTHNKGAWLRSYCSPACDEKNMHLCDVLIVICQRFTSSVQWTALRPTCLCFDYCI